MLLLVASVLVHWPIGPAEFSFDDRDFVQVNASIRSLSGAVGALLTPFPPDQPERGLYRPLTNASYAVDHALHGEDARGYHHDNVALYSIVVLLIHRLALRYLASPGMAFAVALIFSVHPVHADAVDAISGRSELLALLFGLLSMLLFLRAVQGAGATGWSLAGSLSAYALACLSKETGAVLPGVLAFHVALFQPPRDGAEQAQRDRALRFLLPFAVVLLAYLALRYHVLGRFSPEQLVLAGQPFGARLLTMGAVFFEYLRLLVFPRVLQIDFYYNYMMELPTSPSAAALLGLLGLALCLGLLATLVARRLRAVPTAADEDAWRRCGVAIVALASFLIFLFPVSHVLPIGALLAERFLFAPSLGFVLLLVLCGHALLKRLVPDAGRRARTAALLLAAIALLGGWRSGLRAAEWRDNVRLWQATVDATPSDPRAHLNLGTALFDRGKLDAAEAAFQRTLVLAPGNSEALSNLGAIALNRGEYEAAGDTYRFVLEQQPDDFISWTNLGLTEAFRQRHSLAVEHYGRALSLNPNFAPAQENLRESQRIIGEASRVLEEHAEAALSSRDPLLLAHLSAACIVIGDSACADRFAALASEAEGR